LILVRVIGVGVVSVFCRQITTFPSNICWRGYLSPSYVFCTFVKNKVGIAVWIHIWFSILFHWSSCLCPKTLLLELFNCTLHICWHVDSVKSALVGY
jgi:hypothetical protein